MIYIKLQIASQIYYTKIKPEQLDKYTAWLNTMLCNPKPNSVAEYYAVDDEFEIKSLVFKETALEAFSILR